MLPGVLWAEAGVRLAVADERHHMWQRVTTAGSQGTPGPVAIPAHPLDYLFKGCSR